MTRSNRIAALLREYGSQLSRAACAKTGVSSKTRDSLSAQAAECRELADEVEREDQPPIRIPTRTGPPIEFSAAPGTFVDEEDDDG